MSLTILSLALMSYFITPQIRLLDFKIKSIDNALVSNHFNISQKLALLKLQDDLVVERFHVVLAEDMKHKGYHE